MIVISLLYICISCLVIWRATEGFEVASAYLGRNLSEGAKGATINAVGSSMPELFTTLFFLFFLHNADGFAGGVGTTAGSAIFNGMIIPALAILAATSSGVVKSISVSKKVIWRDGITLILVDILLILILGGASTFKWWYGLILMLAYGLYLAFLFGTMKKGPSSEITEEVFERVHTYKSHLKSFFTFDLPSLVMGKGQINRGRAWLLLSISTLIIGGSSALLVSACEDLGLGLGINVYFVAIIIASAATSLPDTILSMRDARKGNYDDAVSNAWGSNIFNICFALGFPLFVFSVLTGENLQMDPETVMNVNQLLIFLLVLTVIAFLIFAIGNSLGKIKAVLLLSLYVFFTLYIIGVAYEWEWALPITYILENAAQGAASISFLK